MIVLAGLWAMLKSFALKLLAWGLMAVAVISMLLYIKRGIEKAAEAKVKVDAYKEVLDGQAKATRARDRVRADLEWREQLRAKYRYDPDSGGD